VSAGTHRAGVSSRSNGIGGRGLAIIGVGIAVLVFVILRPLLTSKAPVLPGTDASNLYAWELYTRSVFAAGRLPHWNPFLFAGTPHLADTETTVLYPPAMLLRFLPPAVFFSWMVALHMCVAGTGTAFLARVLGLRWTAAAAAAVAVTLGGSTPAWIFNGHLILLFATSWLPWVLGLIIYSASRPTVWPHPALVVVLIVQFLSGYLQGTIYIAAASAACVVWLIALAGDGRRGIARWRPLAHITIAGVLAAGLVAFQLLPTIQLVGEAGRTSGVPYSTAVRGGWTAHDLATFFFPYSGIPVESRMRYMGDHTAYVGWLLAVAAPLAFIGREHRRAAILFGGLAAGCIAFVMSGVFPLYRLHYLLFPGLRIPGRMLFIATLSVAILGAIGLDHLLRRAAHWPRPVGQALPAVLVALVLVDLLHFSGGAVQATSPNPAPVFSRIPAVPGRSLSVCDRALGAMDLVIGARPAADGVGGGYLRDYAVFQELALEDGPLRMRRDLLDLSNVTTLISCTPLNAAGLREVGRADVGIVYHNDTAWPRALWTCGAETVTRREAIDQLRQVRYDDQRRLDRHHFVNIRWAPTVDDTARGIRETRYHLAEGVRRDGNTWQYDLQDRSATNVQALLADAGVEDTHGINRETAEVASGEAKDEVLFGTASCSDVGTITEGTVDRPGGDVQVVSEAPRAGLVFMSEPYYPERMAFVDNAPVAPVKANVAFTAVPVPAGRHVVELRYVPRKFQAGLVVSVVTLVAWAGAAGWLPRRRRPRASQTTAAA
jgi:hypothetical protein